MSSIWLRDLASYCSQVALLVGAGALLSRLFRFRASPATLAYWQVLLAACLLLPVSQPWKIRSVQPAVALPSDVVVPALQGPTASGGAGHPAPQSRSWPVTEAILLILAAGVVARGLWLAAGFWSLRVLRQRSSALPGGLEPAFHNTQRSLGVRAEFRTSTRTAAPITFGLRRPAILLPSDICEMPPQAQEAIACHELIHVRRHDWAWCVAEEFVRMLLWFHPGIWWLIGKIHLTREQVVDQAVIEFTESRDEYVEALLAVARAKMQTQLIPAPLFLRKGLLKKRVAEIFKETSMSKQRLIACLVASSFALLLAAGVGVRVFPLEARGQEQKLSSAPIQVIQGGESLVRRAPLVYSGRALERKVEGDVQLEVSVDEHGQVADARVLSGPEELRRACLESVLEWRFGPPTPMPGTTEVLVRFQLPKDPLATEVVLPGVPEETVHFKTASPIGWANAHGGPVSGQQVESEIKMLQDRLSGAATPEDKARIDEELAERKAELDNIRNERTAYGSALRAKVQQDTSENMEREMAELRAGIAASGAAPEDVARMKKELAARETQLASARDEAPAGVYVFTRDEERPISGRLTAIRTERIPQATRDALFPRLGVQVGDMITEQTAQQVRETVLSFDERFRPLFHVEDGNVILVIVGP